MSPEMQSIAAIIEAGAKSAMSLQQIIRLEIDEWIGSAARRWMELGERYYIGDHEILNRKRLVVGPGGQMIEDKNLANHRLVHTFARKLVDQKVGYLLSKPMTVKAEDETYAKVLGDIFNSDFQRILKNIGKEAINKGRAWLHVYYDEEGKLAFKKIPSQEIIPLWSDAAHTKLYSVIRCYDVVVFEGTTKKTITKVEYWDADGVQRYVLDNGGSYFNGGLIPDVEMGEIGSHFVIMEGNEEKPYNWERIPFVCFKYNDEEIPLIKFVQSLIDDYDYQTSDNSNNLADLPNSVYVLKDYDGTDLGEFRKNLAAYRAVKVMDSGGVDTLNLELNPEALKIHLEQLRKDIYEMGRGVDTQSDKFGNSPSGIALKFLYGDLDMDANIIETEFQASLEQLLWFINQHLINTGAGDFTNEKVEFIFNRDILINETDTITNAKNSAGIISEETIVANHPWVSDPKQEMERIQKEKAEAMADPYAGINGHPTPPDGSAPPNKDGQQP